MAINDARERDALLKGITYASEAELEKIFSQRKTHKNTTILLHELAHTLGVIHQREATSILSPHYGVKAERFDPAVVEWMRASLRERSGTRPPGDPPLAETVAGLLTGMPDIWAPTERDELLARLKVSGAQAVSYSASPTPAPAPSVSSSPTHPAASANAGARGASPAPAPSETLPALPQADQTVFQTSVALEKAGKYVDAYDHAKPLFKKYPAALAVQDLRCRLIMRQDATPDTMASECAPFAKLSGLPGK